MTYLVYKHTSPSGKSYIGLTCDYVQRCGKHKSPNSSTCTAFANAIKKYGWDNFTHTILISGVTEDEAKQHEKALIIEHNTLHPNGYNLTTGGEGRRVSEVTKQKIAAARRLLKGKINRPTKNRTGRGHKDYIVVDPEGNAHTITDMCSFCNERGLVRSNMYSITSGKLKTYKGWHLP